MTDGVRVEVAGDEGFVQPGAGKFLNVRRVRLRNHYADGATSRDYLYEVVERRERDAVAVVLHDRRGRVLLREALRPPIALAGDGTGVALWELPAGLVEAGESLADCAARETREETGFSVGVRALRPLGGPSYPTPGIIAERVHLFAAEVDPARQGPAQTDGSAVEERARMRWIALDRALGLCRRGEIADLKTEVGLRRYAETRVGRRRR